MECRERDLMAPSAHMVGSCDFLNRSHGLRAHGIVAGHAAVTQALTAGT